MGLLDGKVALVTGAGGGLGRSYALLLAKEGAKVVVNDLGTSRSGEGEETKSADGVVQEIIDAGGEAVANYDSVADRDGARAMIDEAYESFNGLDIVINNAGILRDKTLVKMEESMWDAVMAVHLKGTFLVSQYAVERMMKAQGGGRIINTTSYAGLKGNFGQTNYGAAKAGIAGFTRSLALESRKFGITTNAIAPVAKTRMTEDIDLVPDAYGADDVAPLVVWLCSDDAESVTGRVFGAHGRHYFEYNVETTPGVERESPWTPAAVGEEFKAITEKVARGGDSDGGEVRELFEALPMVFDAKKAGDWRVKIAFEVDGAGIYGVDVADGTATFVDGAPDGPDGKVSFDSGQTLIDLAQGKLNPQKAFMSGKISANNMGVLMNFAKYFDLEEAGRLLAQGADGGGQESASSSGSGSDSSKREGPNPAAVGNTFKPPARFITPEEMVAYAKAVDDDNPRYLADDSEEPAVGAPLFSVRPLFDGLMAGMADEELDADLLRLVHGEQEMIFHDVLRPWDLVVPRSSIGSVVEKSSGWLVDVEQRLYRDGEIVVEARSGLFVRRADGGKKESKEKKAASSDDRAKSEAPIYEETQTVAADQPRRYAEASGDENPIHLDANVAKSAGLPDVILHGLCTMAFAARAIVNGVLDGQVENLGRIKVRFARPVVPGTVLTTRIWERNPGGEYEFEMLDDQDRPVLTMGEASRLDSSHEA